MYCSTSLFYIYVQVFAEDHQEERVGPAGGVHGLLRVPRGGTTSDRGKLIHASFIITIV